MENEGKAVLIFVNETDMLNHSAVASLCIQTMVVN